MIVELNGQRAELPERATIADAVREAGAAVDGRGVAVAVDGEVIRRLDWAKTRLENEQSVEVVHAVQGG